MRPRGISNQVKASAVARTAMAGINSQDPDNDQQHTAPNPPAGTGSGNRSRRRLFDFVHNGQNGSYGIFTINCGSS